MLPFTISSGGRQIFVDPEARCGRCLEIFDHVMLVAFERELREAFGGDSNSIAFEPVRRNSTTVELPFFPKFVAGFA